MELNQGLKLRICMLLPIRYGPNMRVNPQIGIASYLVNFGHEITWVLSAENRQAAGRATLNGIDIYASPYVRFLSEKFLPGKAVNLIAAMMRKTYLVLKTFRHNKFDLVFVREDTLDGLVGVYLRRKYRIPLVYELASPLEEEWQGYKFEGRKPRLLWYLMAKIKASLKVYVMKRADLVLPTTRWFEEGLVKRGILSAKLMPFPNGIDSDSFANRDGLDIRKKYQLGDSKIILYLGVIGKVRELEVLINAFSNVKKLKQNIKLLMVGDGTGMGSLKRLASELGLEDEVIFAGQVHQKEVPSFIAAADIGIDPRPPTPYYKVSSPIKTFEYMAMGKPVIASIEIFENKEVIEQSGGGILVPFTAEAFACAIIELLENPQRAKEMGRKGYEWVANNRTFETLAHKLEDRFVQITELSPKKIRKARKGEKLR